MTESQRHGVPDWMLALLIAGFSAGGTALIGWGSNSNRMSVLERRSDLQSIDIKSNSTQLASHEKDIAVIQTQYHEIIRRLDSIDDKLNDGDPPPKEKAP